MHQKHHPHPLSIQNRKRSKYSFMLVEVMVSIALLITSGCLFFLLQNQQAKSLLENRLQGERERMHDRALCNFIEKVHLKAYEYDFLRRGATSDIEPLSGGENRWRVSYKFTPYKNDIKALEGDSDEPDEKHKKPVSLRVDVTIQLSSPDYPLLPPPSDAPPSYRFCVKVKQ